MNRVQANVFRKPEHPGKVTNLKRGFCKIITRTKEMKTTTHNALFEKLTADIV